MRKKLLTAFLFTAIFASECHAQFAYDFPQFFRETGRYFTMPLHWDGTDLLMIGSLAAGSVAVAAFELPATPVIPGTNSYLTRPLYNGAMAQFGDFYGGLYTPFILFAGFGGYSLITGDMTARKIAYELGQSCLYAGAIVSVLKYAVGRARPYAGLGKTSFFNFSIPNDAYHSFPSGHCTEAMAMSTVLMFNVEPLWAKILCYVPVPFTIFARAYQGYHWLSDCVFGAGIGFFTAKWCADAHGRVDDAAGQKTGTLEVKSIFPLTVSYAFY